MTIPFPVPTRRLAVIAAAAAVVVLLVPLDPVWTIIVVSLVLLAAAAVDVALAPPPGRITVERELPGVLPLDGEGEVAWHARNPTSRRLTVWLADELAPSLRPTSRRARLVLPANARVTARAVIHPSRRGRFTPSELVLRVEGPLGLAARQRRRQLPGTLRVYPPFKSRQEAELRIDRARILEVGLRSAPGQGGGTEFDSLREYGVDDESRRIDWAATARTTRVIVRTYRAERNQTVLLLLDTGRTMAGRIDDFPRLDHAMDAVMMLTAVATRLGDRAGLVAFDQDVRAIVGPGHARGQLGRVTEAMYMLEPRLVESNYRRVFAQALSRFRRRALLVLLSELAEAPVAESLLPALPLVARDHLVLIAGVRDPLVDEWADGVPTNAGEAYRKAAAVEAVDARRRTIARLRGLGAIVVDAPPGRIAPQLADAYLHLKATGRL
ncbi:MAG: DUF58 domain-containing protein [Acidimicrobiia bacterium]|nr:DUF58 domain-containing protein [Acidimicrobiia bacterium]